MSDQKMAEKEAELRQLLRLGVRAEVTAGMLHVDVAIGNHSSETVYVFDVLWAYSYTGAIEAAPSPAYVCVIDNELRVALRRLPVPAGRKVPVAIDPYATAVPSGAAWRRRLTFPVPVKEYSSYFNPADPSLFEHGKASRLRCILGIVAGAQPGAFLPAPFEPGALRIANAAKLGMELLLESEPVACEVAVLRAPVPFERF